MNTQPTYRMATMHPAVVNGNTRRITRTIFDSDSSIFKISHGHALFSSLTVHTARDARNRTDSAACISLRSIPMNRATFDPGLTQQFTGPLRRAINKDGSFNVHRRGTTWRDINPYLHLIDIGWPAFLSIIFLAYLTANTLFAVVYFYIGPDQLQGGDAPTAFDRFLKAFFFSAHTLTTVGYGSISPRGTAANILAALEALSGLMGFAIATGLLYGRFSKPTAKIGFSDTLVVAPYQDGTSLQFRVVNQRANT